MISRLWHGWTTPENADSYEALIRSNVFPGILGRGIAGLERIELLRRPLGAEVEFVTVMRFASWDAVKAFAGPDWEVSVVPPAARAVLARFDMPVRYMDTAAFTAEAAVLMEEARRVVQELGLRPS